MIVYIIFFVLLLIASLWEVFFAKFNKKDKKIGSAIFVMFGVALFILAAFRDGVGLDYFSYRNNYYDIKSKGMFTGEQPVMEPFFILLNYISPNFRFLIITSVALGVITKLFFFGKFKYKILSLFLYFCSVFLYYDMGIFRQGIAIGFVWMSFKYISKRKPIKFLLMIFVASMFHATSLVALPLYFLGNKKHSRLAYMVLLLLGLCGFILTSNANSIAKAIDIPYISYKIIAYTENIDVSVDLLLPLLKRLLFLLIFAWGMNSRNKRRISNSENDWLLYNSFFLGVVGMIAFLPLEILASRGTACLYFTFIPLFGIVLSRTKKVSIKCLIMCFALYGAIDNLISVLFQSAGATYIPFIFGI